MMPRTDHDAKRLAKELGVSLYGEGKVWVASRDGKAFWGSRPVYALRAWLSDR